MACLLHSKSWELVYQLIEIIIETVLLILIHIFLGSKYTRVAELARALKSEKVEGILVDAYTAGHYKDELDDPAFIAASLIEYPRTFGVVLSGSLANVEKNVADYVESNQARILDILENFTEKMEVWNINFYYYFLIIVEIVQELLRTKFYYHDLKVL